uniref:C-type lectin domain-containing protein n=1 Tax=Poecilia mexicana TaxID=48701 RepID=A0A3B3WRV1_9TELE
KSILKAIKLLPRGGAHSSLVSMEHSQVLHDNKQPHVLPVPNKTNPCLDCRKGWISFRGHCYWFADTEYHSNFWNMSRQMCQFDSGDLVVIDDLEEQVKHNATSTLEMFLED